MRFFILFFAMVVNAGASVLLKIGSKVAEKNPLQTDAGVVDKAFHFLNAPTILALFCFAVNVLAYRRALDEFNLNVAYPVMVTGGLVLVTMAAWLIPMLSEKLSWLQFMGVACVVVGIWLLFANPAPSPSP